MDALSVVLAFVLVTGLGLTLYTAGTPYSRPQQALLYGGGAVFFLVALWHMGVRLTWAVLQPFIAPALAQQARAAVLRLQVNPAVELGAALVYGGYWFALHGRRAWTKARRRGVDSGGGGAA